MREDYGSVYSSLFTDHWWWRSRNHFIQERSERLLTGTRHRILNVGCGDGLFFDFFSRFGKVEGLEADRSLVSEQYQDSVLIGDLTTAKITKDSYTVMLLFDVLEHIENDEGTLNRIYELLVDKGLLLITVPAFKMIWTSHDDINHHYRRYRSHELCALMSSCGFSVIESRYLFFSLFFVKLLVSFFDRDFKKEGRFLEPSVLLNCLVERYFRLENKVFFNPPFGSSLWIVARKNQSRA